MFQYPAYHLNKAETEIAHIVNTLVRMQEDVEYNKLTANKQYLALVNSALHVESEIKRVLNNLAAIKLKKAT